MYSSISLLKTWKGMENSDFFCRKVRLRAICLQTSAMRRIFVNMKFQLRKHASRAPQIFQCALSDLTGFKP